MPYGPHHFSTTKWLSAQHFMLLGLIILAGLLGVVDDVHAQTEIDLFVDKKAPVGTSDKKANAKKTDTKTKGLKTDARAAKPGIVIESKGIKAFASGGAMTLKFKRRNLSMYVLARVNGKKAYFVLDTGASVTTLTPWFAKQLGIMPSEKAPTVQMRTANGVRTSRYGLMGRLRLGNKTHQNVTFTLCASCGVKRTPWGAPIVGLLGMNVMRRYEMKIDEARGLLTLTPGLAHDERWPDINPWLKRSGLKTKLARRGPGVVFSVEIYNRAPAAISKLAVGISCFDLKTKQTINLKSKTVSIGARQKKTLPIKSKVWCRPSKYNFVKASW